MKKLLLSLGALSAVVAPVAAVVACGADKTTKTSVKLGDNTISFHANGFKIDTSWETKTGTTETRNALFSKIDLSSATFEQKAAFLDANFPTAPVNGVEVEEPLSFWTQDIVRGYTFTSTIVKNIFTVDDSKNPATWILGDAETTLAHHGDAEWAKQGATDDQLATFKVFVSANDIKA